MGGFLLLTMIATMALATDHISLAEDLVATITPANNNYNTTSQVVYWQGTSGHAVSEVSTDCSDFMNVLFSTAYGVSPKSWMGCSSPIAQTWYNTILAGNHFKSITNIADILEGDIMAISYKCAKTTCSSAGSGCSSSGHMMMVEGLPYLRASTSPTVAGTYQYEMEVIDVSNSGHGPLDTRYHKVSSTVDDSGVGDGILRVYTDVKGNFTGYTWSTFSNSTYYDVSTRPFVIGRYTP